MIRHIGLAIGLTGALTFAACGDSDTQTGDTTNVDTRSDTGTTDTGSDTGTTDTGSDTGTTDTGSDTGTTDTGSDTGATDTGSDTGTTDTGTTDTGSDTGTTDTGTTDTAGDAGGDAAGDAGGGDDTSDAGGDTNVGGLQVSIVKFDTCGTDMGTPVPLPYIDTDDTTNYTNDYIYDTGAACNGLGGSTWGAASPDVVYQVMANEDVALSFTLDPMPVNEGFDPGMMVTTACGDAGSDSCVSVSDYLDFPETGEQEFLNIQMMANTPYYVHIMGWDNASANQGPYTLTVDLGEDCSNGTDDNADSAVDCADPACSPPAGSPTPPSPFCDESNVAIYPNGCTPGDGVDDDGDGMSDCADSDCAGSDACDEGNATLYPDGCLPTNGVDDDLDGMTDCADLDCAGVDACDEGNTTLYPNGCDPNDVNDDDGDGLLNCLDPDCDGVGACDEGNTTIYPNGCANSPTDDDQDGLVDCDDPDCAVATNCLGPGDSCDQALPLALDTPEINDTAEFNPVYGFKAGDCRGVNSDRGGSLGVGPADIAYQFTPPSTGKYTFSLTQDGNGGNSFDNVLYITTDCTDFADSCLAASDLVVGEGPEVITIELTGGETYFVIVDYWLGSAANTGAFTLSVSAADGTLNELICDDMTDNESEPDGNTDCEDVDCLYDGACFEQCTGGLDEDLDGATDCADADCAQDAACNEAANGAGACDDAADNDGNGLADCFDPTCIDDAACGGVVLGSDAVNPIEVTSEDVPIAFTTNTSLYTDNFKATTGANGCQSHSSSASDPPDGAPDVVFHFTATTAGEYAVTMNDLGWDGIINVIDGASGAPASLYDTCIGGADFDPLRVTYTLAANTDVWIIIDGWSSASGAVIVDFAAIAPEAGACSDGVDNDLNGDTDCDDDACDSEDVCDESSGVFTDGCTDMIDNDGDGDTDCDDIQCVVADPVGCNAPAGDLCVNVQSVDTTSIDTTPYVFGPVDSCTYHDAFFIGTESGGCQSNLSTSMAPDFILEFVAPAAGNYTAEFDDADNFDGIVNVVDGTNGCPTGPITECLDGADFEATGSTSISVTWRAETAGEVVYIIGDGWGATACGNVTTTVSSAPDEDCTNMMDDDGDGDEDCEDSECSDLVACNESLTLGGCTDMVDNDSDGLTDCDDDNCEVDPACNEFATVGGCSDVTIDNDNDGLTDCEDPDCVEDTAACPNGIVGSSCASPFPVTALPFTWQGDTSNFTDNFIAPPPDAGGCESNLGSSTAPDLIFQITVPADGEYAAEFDDAFDGILNLVQFPSDICPMPSEGEDRVALLMCVDSADEPGPPTVGWTALAGQVYYLIADGWAGGSGDATITIFEVTDTEAGLCTDGVDNDQNGAADCLDAACGEQFGCNEATDFEADSCTNEVDDDGDGDDDCDDADCLATAACNEALAGGCDGMGLDEDNDGLTDCDDPNCKEADPVACNVPDGDLCTNAIEIAALPFSDPAVPGTDADPDTCNFANDHNEQELGGCQSTSSLGAEEKVYSYTATVETVLMIEMVPTGASGDPVINVSTQCSVGLALNQCLAAADTGFGGDTETISAVTVAAGQTVYIYATMWGSTACGPYQLTVTEVIP